MSIIIDKNSDKLKEIINRGEILEGEYLTSVIDIINKVRKTGDAALFEYNKKFDRNNSDTLEIDISEAEKCFLGLDDKLQKALIKAKENIASFHEKQLEQTWMYEKKSGAVLGQKVSPIEKAGVYVPGGKAVYPSSVLMNIMPAKVAGVSEIIMVTPALDGQVNPMVLAAAYLAGANRIFTVGGAQAVAALAYGTQSIPKVDKIVGPGNIYVALAKKMVFGAVDIDMIAGPSEILIIADKNARADYVAADMLSQAEHDELASAITVTDDKALAEKIETELYEQLKKLPKSEIAGRSIERYGAIILVDDIDEGCRIANDIAVEHLELMVDNPMELMLKIKNAGAIFLGKYTPEPIGDYIAGPNHVLPTGGTARFFSPLGAYDFIKRSSIIYYTKEQLDSDMQSVLDLSETEELIAHRNSVEIRKN